MFDNIFGIHEQALILHGQRIGVLANNLANADTPNYKARDIDFTSVLGAANEQMPLAVSITHAGQITPLEGELPSGELKYRNPYQASLDGNTVEMPVEQAALQWVDLPRPTLRHDEILMRVHVFPMSEANHALQLMRRSQIRGAAVLQAEENPLKTETG